MPDMAVIGGISNSLNVALNIAKAMLGIRDQALVQEKVIELTREIISAQQSAAGAVIAQAALAERVRDLEKQLVEMKAWDAERQRYELRDIEAGAFVYALKGAVGLGEPPHWLCARCYQDGKKSILQNLGYGTQPGPDMRVHRWACQACGGIVRTRESVAPSFGGGEREGK